MPTLAHNQGDLEHALGESEERFRAVVETASDAIILADRHGTIMSWNRAAQALFGYFEKDVLGKPLTMIMPARYREAHQKGLERVRATGHSRLTGKPIELHGLRKDGSEFPLELSLGTWNTPRGTFFSGIIRDITDRKQAEQRLNAQLATARVLAMASTLRDAAPQLLRTICETLRWDLGIFWTVDRQANLLSCLEAWYPVSAELAELASLNRDRKPAAGETLPGRVWAERRPIWIPDVHAHTDSLQETADRMTGLCSIAGFPIMLGDEVLGVLELYCCHVRQPDSAQTDAIAAVCSQIGQFIDRDRTDAALRKSTEQLARTNECLLSFGKDADENINKLTALCGELLGGTWAIYSYLDGELLHSIGRWRTPPGFVPVDKPNGHICSHVIRQGKDDLFIIRHLPTTPYAQTDPLVLPHGLQTYLGHAVKRNGRHIGSLCVVYQHDVVPREGDRRLMGIIASAIGVEEERKQAEQALRQAYDETERILAGLPGAILVVNEQQRIVYANSLACQYFGDGRTVMVGALLGDILPAQEVQRSQFFLGRTPVSAEDGSWKRDREFESHKRTYRYRLFPIAIRGSERPQAGFVIWDITEQKQLHDQLVQAEKLASLGTLVSGMAHEINNPAQAILGLAEIMVDERAPEKIREYAMDIIRYSQHIGGLVRDFACYTRSAANDKEVAVDLSERLTQAVKMVRRCPQFGHVEVITEFHPAPPLRARRSEIDQVFVNLVSNAVQAMQGEGHLTLATRCEDGMIEARISDTGCGIPKALLHKIFDPFFTTKEPGVGTGLGLSIVYKIMSKYGGRISVESEEHKGTTFIVAFPTTTLTQEVPNGTERYIFDERSAGACADR